MNSTDIADVRKDIMAADLGDDASHADPLRQFELWVANASTAQSPDLTAMSLSTVGRDMRPSSRMVHMKACDDRGIVWFTNYQSRKANQIAENPFAALLFHWRELERMVRIEGRVEKTSEDESEASFKTRPLDYRIGSWASPQSQVIGSRALIVGNAAKYGAQFLLGVPRPEHWGGYRLVPEQWEFWQGRKTKIQDRVRYTRRDGAWVRERLAP